MIAAHQPAQRPMSARLLVVDACGCFTHAKRSQWVDVLRPGDLVVANDAATVPGSLHGIHLASGAPIEVRLSAWSRSGAPGRHGIAASGAPFAFADVRRFAAVVFGAGDYHTRTEDRPLPPPLAAGDRLALGPLTASIETLLGHPRLVALRFAGTRTAIWEGIARHGRPIQYAHVPTPLHLWDVWSPVAAVPVAFEAPSASFVVDGASVRTMREHGVAFATITMAAGISSTGDADLDRRLPLDEPYRIPAVTAMAIRSARAAGGRIVAIGTTVVRALEHAAAADDLVRAVEGIATQRIGPDTDLRVVDAILSGTHEAGTSHYELLRAFHDDETVAAADAELERVGYLTHEFGDSVFVVNGRSEQIRRRCGKDASRLAA